MSGKAAENEARVPCSFCGKQSPPHNPELKEAGVHVGNGGALGHNIMNKFYQPGKSAGDHPLSIPEDGGEYSIAQAHHLIPSETMKEDAKWEVICANFGYNINHWRNGVFLPSDMRIACHLQIPLHRGNHSYTETGETPRYVNAVENMINPVKKAAKEYCKEGKDIIAELNKISKDIWDNVISFTWILTSDGRHYRSKELKGCMNVTRIGHKKLPNAKNCLSGRNHGLNIAGDYFIEKKK